jgi:2-keto-3-deoxy-L-rhamnonate aldolase RhmA
MKNRLRNLLKRGEPTIGTRFMIPWPGIIEVIGETGVFDYVEFLAEYSPFDLHDLENFARAAELKEISSMIKVDQEPRTYLAERALAAGIQNILFTDIRTVEDAETAVKAVRNEPRGINGVRSSRGVNYRLPPITLTDVVRMHQDAIVAIMVERKSAVENLETILAVEGIDMVQFGPSDYSVSIGVPGERNHPKVREAELKTIKTALDRGIPPRAEISDPQSADRYIRLGVKDFSLHTDIRVLYDWLKENGNELRKIVE